MGRKVLYQIELITYLIRYLSDLSPEVAPNLTYYYNSCMHVHQFKYIIMDVLRVEHKNINNSHNNEQVKVTPVVIILFDMLLLFLDSL